MPFNTNMNGQDKNLGWKKPNQTNQTNQTKPNQTEHVYLLILKNITLKFWPGLAFIKAR